MSLLPVDDGERRSEHTCPRFCRSGSNRAESSTASGEDGGVPCREADRFDRKMSDEIRSDDDCDDGALDADCEGKLLSLEERWPLCDVDEQGSGVRPGYVGESTKCPLPIEAEC